METKGLEMEYFPSDLYDDIPSIFTDAKPKFLSSSGSGYPWHLLNEEPISDTLALVLSDMDCIEMETGEELQDCW